MNNFEQYMFLYVMRNKHATATEINEGNMGTILGYVPMSWDNTGSFVSIVEV
jgi:hypothetical protein